MILRKKGDVFWYNDKKYVVGEKVIATSESEYEGMIGKIIGIYDGEDKETDNDTPDIYCSFREPILKATKEKVKERFSKLWVDVLEIDDINIEQAVMAPDMIIPIDTLQNNKDKRKIYILVEDAAIDGNETVSVDAFTDYKDAKRYLEIKLNDEMENGMLLTPGDPSDFIIEETEDSYEIYRKGRYCEWHYSVYIKEYEADLSEEFINEIGKLFVHKIFAGDFEAQVETWDEFADFTDKEYTEFIRNPEIPKRIAEDLKNDENFMSEYLGAVCEIAHKIVDEEVKRRMEAKK